MAAYYLKIQCHCRVNDSELMKLWSFAILHCKAYYYRINYLVHNLTMLNVTGHSVSSIQKFSFCFCTSGFLYDLYCIVLFIYNKHFHFFLQSIFRNLAYFMCPILNIQNTRHSILYNSLQKNVQLMRLFYQNHFLLLSFQWYSLCPFLIKRQSHY